MKSEGQVRQKIKQVLFRHRKRKIREGLKKTPCNCKFNGHLDLPDSFLSERDNVNLCTYPGNLQTCDERITGDLEKAQQCPFFVSEADIENVKSLFDADLLGRNLVEVAEVYPDAAALMWVLEIDNYQGMQLDWEEEEDS